MTSYRFFKMATIPSQIYFRFRVWCRLQLKRSKGICTQNLVQISHSAAEILLLTFSENKQRSYWKSTSGFDSDYVTVMSTWFCIDMPNFVRTERSTMELWHHIDFQDGGHNVANLFLVFGLATCHFWERLMLFGHQITTRYANPRLIYYYFRFLKTNGCRIRIKIHVSILT